MDIDTLRICRDVHHRLLQTQTSKTTRKEFELLFRQACNEFQARYLLTGFDLRDYIKEWICSEDDVVSVFKGWTSKWLHHAYYNLHARRDEKCIKGVEVGDLVLSLDALSYYEHTKPDIETSSDSHCVILSISPFFTEVVK